MPQVRTHTHTQLLQRKIKTEPKKNSVNFHFRHLAMRGFFFHQEKLKTNMFFFSLFIKRTKSLCHCQAISTDFPNKIKVSVRVSLLYYPHHHHTEWRESERILTGCRRCWCWLSTLCFLIWIFIWFFSSLLFIVQHCVQSKSYDFGIDGLLNTYKRFWYAFLKVGTNVVRNTYKCICNN